MRLAQRPAIPRLGLRQDAAVQRGSARSRLQLEARRRSTGSRTCGDRRGRPGATGAFDAWWTTSCSTGCSRSSHRRRARRPARPASRRLSRPLRSCACLSGSASRPSSSCGGRQRRQRRERPERSTGGGKPASGWLGGADGRPGATPERLWGVQPQAAGTAREAEGLGRRSRVRRTAGRPGRRRSRAGVVEVAAGQAAAATASWSGTAVP